MKPFRTRSFTADDAEHAIILMAKMMRQEFAFEFYVMDHPAGVAYHIRPQTREGQKYLTRIVKQT